MSRQDDDGSLPDRMDARSQFNHQTEASSSELFFNQCDYANAYNCCHIAFRMVWKSIGSFTIVYFLSYILFEKLVFLVLSFTLVHLPIV